MPNKKFDIATFVNNDTDKVIEINGDYPNIRIQKGQSLGMTFYAVDESNNIKKIDIKEKIAEGGEGAVFKTSNKSLVAKIYFEENITVGRKEKIKIIVSSGLKYKGICLPVALLVNNDSEFIGYLMPKAEADFSLETTIFRPRKIKRDLPAWTRKDLIQLCITICKMFKYLNSNNVIVGDINGANILFNSPKEVYFVDCDSYQIEGYPCTVCKPQFLAPELQGKSLRSNLRNIENENFAIATILFMILMVGKMPYTIVEGGSIMQNIKNGDFPYPHDLARGENMPPGSWGYIWLHLSYNVRLAFFETFRKGEAHNNPSERYDANDWCRLLSTYHNSIDKMAKNDSESIAIVPSRRKKKQCEQEGCENYFVPTDREFHFCPEHSRVRTKPCKNPKCSNNVEYFEDDLKPNDFCNKCWENASCPICGSASYTKNGFTHHYKKWMIDENGGMCSSCKKNGARSVSSTTYSYKRPSSATPTTKSRVSTKSNTSNSTYSTNTSKNKNSNSVKDNKTGWVAYIIAAIIFFLLGVAFRADGFGWIMLCFFYFITVCIIFIVRKNKS